MQVFFEGGLAIEDLEELEAQLRQANQRWRSLRLCGLEISGLIHVRALSQ